MTTTEPAGLPEKEETDYRTKNKHLGAQRLALVAQRDDLAAKRGTAARRREIRSLEAAIGDIEATMLTVNAGLVHSYVKQFTQQTPAHNADDFTQSGTIGLLRSIQNYDPEKGAFSPWAMMHIKREVLRSVKHADFPHLSPTAFESRKAILATVEELKDGDDESQPTPEEVADRLRTVTGKAMPLGRVRSVMSTTRPTSLSAPVGERDSELSDILEGSEGSLEEAVIMRASVTALEQFGLPFLDDQERMMLHRRFGLDGEPVQDLRSLGDQLNLSREAARQIEHRALAKLKHPLVLRRMLQNLGT